MTPQCDETVTLRAEPDLVLVRQLVKERSIDLGFNIFGRTKLVVAANELGRNTIFHGGGGTMLLESVVNNERRGLRLTFRDNGSGIANLEQAMTDGFSTQGGLGLGLGGSRRLVDEFEISSRAGEGTRISTTRWA